MPQFAPVLYSFRRCPYAIRARLALRYAGITCELREVVLRDKPAAMLEASAKGTVPVLLVPGAQGAVEVIDESLDIMLWALAQHDPDGWLATDSEAARLLIDANDDDFKIWLDRYKYPDRYDDIGAADCRAECERFLAALDDRLRDGRYLTGAALRFVDIAVFPFVRQFAAVDTDWFRATGYSRLQAWLVGLLASDLFAAVMAKYPVWQPGDEPQMF